MGYFITDPVGLGIAFCNVLTFVLLVYLFLGQVAAGQSRLHAALDRFLGPVLAPVRRIATIRGFDTSPLLLAAVLQCIAFVLGRRLP